MAFALGIAFGRVNLLTVIAKPHGVVCTPSAPLESLLRQNIAMPDWLPGPVLRSK